MKIEHDLRMAFDEDYERRYLLLEEDRKLCREVVLSRKLFVPLFIAGTVMAITINPATGIIIPPLIWAVASLVFLFIEDRRMKKDFGF